MAAALLRPARWRDLRAVLLLNRQCFDEPYPFWRFASFVLSLRTWLTVAERDDRIVGYCVLSETWYPKPPRLVGELTSLAVDAQYRRAGLGRALLQNALATAADRGLGQTYLQVAVHNAAAEALYREAGFVRESLLPGYYVNGDDAWLMVHQGDGG